MTDDLDERRQRLPNTGTVSVPGGESVPVKAGDEILLHIEDEKPRVEVREGLIARARERLEHGGPAEEAVRDLAGPLARCTPGAAKCGTPPPARPVFGTPLCRFWR